MLIIRYVSILGYPAGPQYPAYGGGPQQGNYFFELNKFINILIVYIY